MTERTTTVDTRELHRGWTLHPVAGEIPPHILAAGAIPATVPGTVHTDLLAAGLIPDPYVGQHEADLVWLHRSAFEYRLSTRLAAPAAGERVELEFDGLDTVATIRWNGKEIARSANMHRSYRVDLTDLAPGEGELSVRFDSALEHAESVEKDVGARPRTYDHPYNAVRKMACSFGWDWGPDLQTAGIWRPVRLRRWRTARFASVRTLATLEGTTGHLEVHATLERTNDTMPVTVRLQVGDRTVQEILPPGRSNITVTTDVPDAPVWWPRSHGDQPLVDVELALFTDSEVLDVHRTRTGFRNVRWEQVPDEFGTSATLVVNDVPLFVRGLNWIPRDHLLTRLDAARYAAALDDAVDANANLLRVWGGGIWEDDEFYSECDERGLLVWQDVPLACAAYAEEEPLRSEIVAEVRENVARLSPHPALVVWNGGNENLQGFQDWGWKEELGSTTWGAGYYEEIFPALFAELDPTRPYQPGSPASPAPDLHPNDPDHGTNHEWTVWNQLGWEHYRDRVPRFCSEYGWQAPPTSATIAEFLPADERSSTSETFLAHQKALDGNGKLDRGMAPHTGVPADFEDWVWAAQLNQARAVAAAVEHHRSWWPRTAGSIYWQLDDCWPVTSWSVVDSAGRRKPAFHALARAFAPRMLSIQPRDGVPHLALINDTDEPFEHTGRARRTTVDGAVLASAEFEIAVPPRSVHLQELPLLGPDDEPVVVDVDGLRTVHVGAPDKDLTWNPAPVQSSVTETPDGYDVQVRARALARDVTFLVETVDPQARVDDGLVTLLPGETHTFHVRCRPLPDPDAFSSCVRTANLFGTGS